jgi:Fe-S cluster biogenesis protein NfuA
MSAGADATIEAAVADVRALVAADGGDVVLDGVDADGTVRLTLVLADAHCAECVMPRPFLERVALDVLRRTTPAVAGVAIDDPRERPAPA